MADGGADGLRRRDLLQAGLAAGAGLALAGIDVAQGEDGTTVRRAAFGALADGEGWGAAWACPGVANLRVRGSAGVLEAGSDVFPDDPRPVAFLVDCRALDATVRADVARAGSMVGVVVRRTGPRAFYAAVLDRERAVLAIVRRSDSAWDVLAQTPVLAPAGDLQLELRAAGASPTTLAASLTSSLGRAGVEVRDGHPPLQAPGDPGVLAQARTLFPSAGPAVLPALGNLHLLPYGVQEGAVVLESPGGQVLVGQIREASSATFREVAVTTAGPPQPTPASVVAATTGVPARGGARLHVASDLPAEVVLEVADGPDFAHPRRVAAGPTGPFEAFTATVRGLPAGRAAHWRATLRRAGTTSQGPVRRLPVLPGSGSPDRARLAVASCAAQFGPIFDHLARERPDVLVWQGDLNYPDTHGPLAQTTTGYAGIWRDFLANPRLAPLLERSAFVAVRDDHDYAAQDSNAQTIARTPWGVAPWDALMGDGLGHRFSAGLADVWVLDQRRHKSDPTLPDRPGKTLLGPEQWAWLLEGLAASTAPFKVICSPCTVFMPFNARDGNWATGFTAERDALLEHLDRRVSGRTVFVTGDTHLTGVFDDDRRFEVRAAPLDIPVPNDVTLSDPLAGRRLRATPGVAYADERGHVALLDVRGDGDTAVLEVRLLRQDGQVAHRRTFREPIPDPDLRVAVPRTGLRALREGRRLRVDVALDRPGRVRVRVTLERLRGGRRALTRLADRLVGFDGAGRRRVTLVLPRRRALALGRPGRLRLRVLARHRPPSGRAVLRRARRTLRRGG